MEFKGLHAQYIIFLAGGILGLLILLMVVFIIGLDGWFCLLLAAGLGSGLVTKIYQLNRRHGTFGLMKKRASKKLPVRIRSGSRKIFFSPN